MKIKLTDYVAEFLADQGVTHVFGLTGGAVVHFFDSLERNPRIEPIFNHHEQASAFAAEAYAKVSGNLGACIVTTGPGGTNALTGLCAAWLDSVPCVYISGQSRKEHTSRGKPFRQLGTQELDIVSIVSHMTNYAVMLEDPSRIKYELQKAVYLARHGRPGPVWIDIPLNFEWAMIEPDTLPDFKPEDAPPNKTEIDGLKTQIEEASAMLARAERPIVVAGFGVKLAGAQKEFKKFVERFDIPFVTSWNACDVIPTSHRLNMGRLGISGQRGANLAVQNSDLLLSVGSHLCIPQTGTNYDAFARAAKKIVVNIDRVQLENPTVRVDLPIQCDARHFLRVMLASEPKGPEIEPWKTQCVRYKSYNAIPPEWKELEENINPYVFIDMLSDILEEGDVVVVDGGGTSVYASFQAFKIKEGQQLILSSGLAAMGSGLPESIGACFAHGSKRVICLCGDGSMQLNVQEMQTLVHHKLPIKIFLSNNSGYLSIRGTQDGFLDGRHVGSDASGGMSLPDFKRVADAYGIQSTTARNHRELAEKIRWTLEQPGPALCELIIPRDQELAPRLGFNKKPDGTFAPRPLEDMMPYLPRDEFRKNMLVAPLPESRD